MKIVKKTIIKFLALVLFISLLIAFLSIGQSDGFLVFATANLNSVEKNLLVEFKEEIGAQGHQYERVYNETGNVETYELPIDTEYIDYLSEKLYFDNSDATNLTRTVDNPFEVTTIIDSNLPDAQSIVVVFMGDGYVSGDGANQQGTWPNPVSGSFLSQAYEAAQTLLDTHPFDIFSHLFKIYAIQVVSNEVGITGSPDGKGDTKDTYFGVNFNAASSITMPSSQQIHALDLANSVSNEVRSDVQ